MTWNSGQKAVFGLAGGLALLMVAMLTIRAQPAPTPQPMEEGARKLLLRRGDPTATHCEICHTVDSWSRPNFSAHDKTGFPLRSAHQMVACKECHPVDFDQPVPHVCEACHRDVHGGSLGATCKKCHSEIGWNVLAFDADGHRRTNFPLIGRHALIPCTECHQEQREKSFTRVSTECLSCHAQDYANSPFHQQVATGTLCNNCHNTWRFAPARFNQQNQLLQQQLLQRR